VPKAFTINLGRRFLAIAKETRCLDDAACERLDEMRRDLEDHRTTDPVPLTTQIDVCFNDTSSPT
jgi:hypothetical protein